MAGDDGGDKFEALGLLDDEDEDIGVVGGEAVGHEACLAGACGGQYEQGAVEVTEDLLLHGIKISHRIAGILRLP